MSIPFDELAMHIAMKVPENGELSREILDKYCALYPEHSKEILEFASDWFMLSLQALAQSRSTDEMIELTELTELTEQDLTIVDRWYDRLMQRFEDVK